MRHKTDGTIQKDLDDGIDTIGKKMTICQLYAKQIRHRGNVRYNTKNGRKRLMKLLEEDKLGSCPIDSVKLFAAKEWAIRMKEKRISYKTISNDKQRCTRGYKRYKETSGLIEWKECQIFHSIFT